MTADVILHAEHVLAGVRDDECPMCTNREVGSA